MHIYIYPSAATDTYANLGRPQPLPPAPLSGYSWPCRSAANAGVVVVVVACGDGGVWRPAYANYSVGGAVDTA